MYQVRIGHKTAVGGEEKTGQVDDQGTALSVKSPEPAPQPGTLAQASEPKSEPQTLVSPDGDCLAAQGQRQGQHKVQEGEEHCGEGGKDDCRTAGPPCNGSHIPMPMGRGSKSGSNGFARWIACSK